MRTPSDAELARSRTMIADPDTWPAWPRLPLVRRERTGSGFGDATDFGYLLDGDLDRRGPYTEPFTVHIGLIFGDIPSSGQVETYADVDALLQVWRID